MRSLTCQLECLLLIGGLAMTAVGEEIRIEDAGLVLIDVATVSASDGGNLVKVLVREGKRVKAGELLGQLDKEEHETELARSKTELRAARQRADNDVSVRIAKKELALADLELRRAEELNMTYANTVSVSQMERLVLTRDRRRLEMESAESELRRWELAAEVAERNVEASEMKLRRRSLPSPIAGVVVEVFHKPGEWVQAGEPLFRVLRADRLQATAYVAAARLTTQLEGLPATMLIQLPGKGPVKYRGVVTFVSPEANPVNGDVKALIEIDNHDGLLRAGYLGTLLIDTDAPVTTPVTNHLSAPENARHVPAAVGKSSATENSATENSVTENSATENVKETAKENSVGGSNDAATEQDSVPDEAAVHN